MNGTILANRSAVDRNKTDYYATPPDVTVALLNFLEEQGRIHPLENTIWEPACGTGEMVEAMAAKGYTVYCSDLNPTGYRGDTQPVDFLTMAVKVPEDFWIITNPPFLRRKSSSGGRWSWTGPVLSC